MEIERKWLIDPKNIPYDLSTLEHCEIEQAYISFSPTIRVRKMNDDRFILTVKSKPVGNGLSREEYELDISRQDFDNLLKKAEGNIINKTRYYFHRDDGLLEEIDIFHGIFEGLSYMDIEFSSDKDAEGFPSPYWVTRDVSKENGFSNDSLARNGMPDI